MTIEGRPYMTLHDFPVLFQQAQSRGVLDEWIRFLFTPGEREDLSKRLELIQALLQGEETQRDISKHHHVSIATITRGSNALKEASPELVQFLKECLAVVDAPSTQTIEHHRGKKSSRRIESAIE
jgi:TrpR family trp operon transcriptional repressor